MPRLRRVSLERKRRVIDRVVLHPELAHAQRGPTDQPFDEGGKADLQTNGRIAGPLAATPGSANIVGARDWMSE